MPDAPPIRAVIGLPPDETVRAFDARQAPQLTTHWSEMWQEDHARAFTVAKVAKLDLLQEIQASLADVIANGGTFEQWRAGLQPYLERQGWWGVVQDRGLTGTDQAVTVGPRRLRTIYDTNLRVSRAAGRWSRIQALAQERPFLRYTAVLDARTRPAHRAWHGTILPVDHAWWDVHFPPCGWYCRCTVRQLSQRDLDAKGWKVTGVPPSGPATAFYRAGSATPVMVPAGVSPGFGYNPGKASMAAVAPDPLPAPVMLPAGISPGFGHNPGKEPLRSITDKAVRSLEAIAPKNLAAARSTLAELVNSPAFPAGLDEPGVRFPVMVLDDRARARIGATNSVAVLSSDAWDKQLGRTTRSTGHLDIGPDQYRQLPAIGASPDYIFDAGKERHFAFFRADAGKYLVAIVKALSREGEMFVLSLRWAETSEIKGWLKDQPDAGQW